MGDPNSGQSPTLAELLAVRPQSPSALEVTFLLNQAIEPVEHLRSYVESVLARQEQLDRTSPQEVADSSSAGIALDEARRTALRSILDGAITAQEHQVELDAESSALMAAEPASVAARPFDWAFQAMQELDPMAGFAEGLLPALRGPTLEGLYVMEYLMAYNQQPHLSLVLRAQAIVATAQIQPYVARLMSVVLRSKDDASNRPSLAHVDGKVKKLLLSGPKKWRTRIVAPYGLHQLDRALDWDELEREWDLRNLLVHRGGVIDQAYRTQHPTDLPVGAFIDLTPDDIDRLFDLAVSTRFAFALASAERIDPGRGAAAACEHYVWYWPQFTAGHFRAALGIARAALSFATDSEDAATAQVNVWLARERLGDQESVQSEVTTWDPASLPTTFQLARLVLLHDDELAIKLLDELVIQGLVTPDNVRTLPLFARLREAGSLS